MSNIIRVVLIIFLGGAVFYGIIQIGKLQKPNFGNLNNQAEKNLNQEPNLATEPSGFIESLRKRKFSGGEIKVEETLPKEGNYTSYIISYPSDNLKIYGMMNVPDGGGPFPVIVLNHGYFNPSSFNSGDGTRTIADILAKNGYLTLASDYRSHGKSDSDNRGRGGHRPEYAIDVLNLIASVKSLPKADVNKIGMWGHSMGGEVSICTVEVTDKVKVVVLWAPTSPNPPENAAFYGRSRHFGSP